MSVIDAVVTTAAGALDSLGVGPVHAQLPYVQNLEQLMASFQDASGVRGWVVSIRRLRWLADSYGTWLGTTVLLVEGMRAVNSAMHSERAFREDIDRVLSELRDTLYGVGAVLVVRRVELVRYDAAREIGNVVCHYAEIEVEADIEHVS